MKSLIFAFGLVLSLSCWNGQAEEPSGPDFSVTSDRLKLTDVVTEIPQTTWNTLKFGFQRDSVPVWWGLTVSTALLYRYDADIYESTMAQGRRWNLSNEDKTKTIFHLGPYPLLRLPGDTGSALYFLGDGWIHFGISLGFTGFGYLSNTTRAWNTGLEIFHGMMVSTIFNQAFKRSTGRECPNHRTDDPRGVWRPFPSIKAYNSNTPRYDAFPSGHVMTATLVFTTIRLNYPEYSTYIWPLQILWSSALMFEMVNNGVHWASDYPLGIAMGWAVAKMAVHMGQPGFKAVSNKHDDDSWAFFPSVGPDGEPLVGAMRSF